MHVTVCICTRNRGPRIAATLRSLAVSTYEDFDVVIVDQSTTDDTAQAVQDVTVGDERFSYLRSPTVGKSVALNIAIVQARGPIIAFTDDDCEVSPHWLAAIVDAFCRYPDAGEVRGTVKVGPFDPTQGFIHGDEVRHFERLASPWLMWRVAGVGANTAFRQEALKAAGPFDEMLGPGGPFLNCEDGDMTYRVLCAGYSVLNVPDSIVIHHGFRTFAEGKMLTRETYLAISAAYMKHLRLGDLAILPTILYFWLFKCISWKNLLLFRKRTGLARFLYFSWGLIASFRCQVDRRSRLYRPRQRRVAGGENIGASNASA